MNLHHFLRGGARRREFASPPVLAHSDLSKNKRAAWTQALDAYIPLAKLSLIFDDRLVHIIAALATVANSDSLPTGTVEPDVGHAQNTAPRRLPEITRNLSFRVL